MRCLSKEVANPRPKPTLTSVKEKIIARKPISR